MLPQLKIARVRLPLGVAVGLMPRGILASPLPQISDETIPIALQEIVSQLPPNLFASQSNSSEMQEIDFSDSEIPTPFTEKTFTSAPVEAQAPEPVQPEFVPAPIAAKATPEPIEISPSTLEDEGLSIFAEKSAVTAPTPVEFTPKPEPVVEPPVAQAEVTPEEPVFAEKPRIETTAEVVPVVTAQPSVFVETPAPAERSAAPSGTGKRRSGRGNSCPGRQPRARR